MHQLLRQRASRLVQRRQDDIKDESSEFASLSSQSILKVFMIYLNSLVSSVYVCARERKSLFASVIFISPFMFTSQVWLILIQATLIVVQWMRVLEYT